jgi:four helix bundle protein
MAEYGAWQSIEDFDVFKELERLSDEVWVVVTGWKTLAQQTIGQQLVRACDSIGANLTEGDGRYHHKETLNFYYIARASLKETRYWLRRAGSRSLLDGAWLEVAERRLENIRRWINTLISYRRKWISEVREEGPGYLVDDNAESA